ncbi:hypothetical protein [Candidatus Bathycorpusculum sp.]|uniref:Kelch repeat-containing protein n=1 Tax=Candidatus Bathycorpusculum sp. TaxID=2994959 RepID=UPI00283460F9|nr:hypothetical protein [Candidatus Termitimicrobium sp.]
MNKIIPFMLIFFFISGTFATTTFNSVSALELVEDSWNTKTPSSDPERVGFRVVAVEGKIYAIGGFHYVEVQNPFYPQYGESYLGTNEQYDPVTDTWITLATMPTPRAHFAITEYQGKIYCIGSLHMHSCVVEAYDPATDSWSTKADLPVSLPYPHHTQAHVVNDKLFVRTFNELFMYNSVQDSWIEKTPIHGSELRHYVTSVVVDDKIIVFYPDAVDNTYDQPFNVNVAIYDPKMDGWSEGKTQEIGLDGSIMGAGVTTGVYAPKNVYLFGSNRGSQFITWVYNLEKDAWSTAKAAPNRLSVYGVTEIDDVLYVFGSTENGEVNMQYVPIGYEPRGYQTFPTGYVVAIIGLTASIVIVITSLFFYTKRRKNR